MLEFSNPWALCLLPVVAAVVVWARGSLAGLQGARWRVAVALRSLAVLLTVLALAGLRTLRDDDQLTVIFIVDRSDSVPAARRELVLEHVREAQVRRRVDRDDRVGVVVFGRRAGVEVPPAAARFELQDVATLIDPGATSIQEAIQVALTAFPDAAGGRRLVLLSDGNENVGRALDEVRGARAMGVVVDVVPIEIAREGEVAVEKVHVAPEVRLDEPYSVQAVVTASRPIQARVLLYENGRPVGSRAEVQTLEEGKNFFQFSGLRHPTPGRYDYEVAVEPVRAADDGVARNNVGLAFTSIRGTSVVLLVSDHPERDASLVSALRAEGFRVRVTEPEYLPRATEEWLDVGALVLSDVGAHRFSTERMSQLEALVEGMGLGFVMVGGEESFGAGGYQGTPIERLLPVELEIRQRKKVPTGAIAFVVHSCELENGNYWARKVIQRAIRALSTRDWAGVISHDHAGRDRWLFPMTRCAPREKLRMHQWLGTFQPGDMPSFQPILERALAGLRKTDASVRHIVILSDGDPGGPSDELVSAIVDEEKITISTVCYGAHGQVPPEMPRLAARAGGEFYHLRDPARLPEIFIREASILRRALIQEQRFVPAVVARGAILEGLADGGLPALDGYVLTQSRPLADLLLVRPAEAEGTEPDPDPDPVLAAWRYGLGRSVAFTSDSGSRWARGWVSWPDYRRFWGQTLRWASRVGSDDRLRISRQVSGERARIIIDAVSATGDLLSGLDLRGRVIGPGPDFVRRPVVARPIGPGRYVVEFSVVEEGTWGVHLQCEEDGRVTSCTTGVSVGCSPEYRELTTHRDLLGRLAQAGGGRVVEDTESVDFFARDVPRSRQVRETWSALLTAALLLFFADLVIRRLHVDLRGLYRRLARRTGRRGSESGTSPADERLRSLLRAKTEVRRRSTAVERPQAATVARPPEETAGAPPERGEEAASGERVERATREERVAEAAPDEDDGYTGRLLRAKRRALGIDPASDEDRDSERHRRRDSGGDRRDER